MYCKLSPRGIHVFFCCPLGRTFKALNAFLAMPSTLLRGIAHRRKECVTYDIYLISYTCCDMMSLGLYTHRIGPTDALIDLNEITENSVA